MQVALVKRVQASAADVTDEERLALLEAAEASDEARLARGWGSGRRGEGEGGGGGGGPATRPVTMLAPASAHAAAGTSAADVVVRGRRPSASRPMADTSLTRSELTLGSEDTELNRVLTLVEGAELQSGQILSNFFLRIHDAAELHKGTMLSLIHI